MKFPPKIPQPEFDELVRPKLRLFLSVDVVASSDMKYKHAFAGERAAGVGPEWVFQFQSFYVEFPKIFRACLPPALTVSRPSTLKPGTPHKRQRARVARLVLWKALGDELIFVVELLKRSDAAAYLKAFCTALQNASDNWREPWRLQFKGTAWLAGFPLMNAEIPVMDDLDSLSLVPDFLGPQIDTGFRLKEHSTPRKLILSAELAYLLAHSGTHCPLLYFDGDQPLKGILRGRPYPLIWIDCEKQRTDGTRSLNQKKDRLLKREHVAVTDVIDFLGTWMDEVGGEVARPFIHTDRFADLRPPPHYETQLEEWKARLRAQFVQERPDATASGGSKVPPKLEQFLKDL